MSDVNKNTMDGDLLTIRDSSGITRPLSVNDGRVNMRDCSVQSIPRHQEIETHIKSIERRIKENEKLNSILRDTLENLQSFEFKEGDIVVSRTEGNSIVMGIGIGSDGFSSQIDDDFPNQFYVLIATKKGYAKVPPKDIMPYTIASKVLYEKK